MKIAALQTVSGTTVAANLEAARGLLAQAAGAGAELAVLPEYFCLMGQKDRDKFAVRERFGSGPVQDFLAAQARALGLWIVGGTLPLEADSEEHVRNTSLAYSPQGECVARYDKVHLFRFDNGREQYDESRVIEPGDAPQAFVLPSRDGHAWRVGLSVCYDLRFPELYRGLGADLLLVPSAFTHPTGEAHWELLLRARAVENLAYVCAPAQGGRHENGRRTWGHSMVVDPWGEVLAQRREDGAGVVLADLEAARIAQVRTQLPALEHKVL
ncbi:carbon-nitrogen hydrolase family protein [Ramlibacter sp. USB13]|uniref:Carbon-nitrogen hydrolase family protein n=1 Tax=Ramlibacter cellulosilyticus TaxID=2764187 RepID=A0A923MPH5_9BURK|nr:carbon-nitrogen hydrolase family protein [Ramlibacter cellulosilyticus]MBC5782820.1 carbon-nitrogen hydrolase family protein [Ramlibacter cellulosilyticus]